MTPIPHSAVALLLSGGLLLQPVPRTQRPGTGNDTVPKVGCEECPSRLLIAVDADCTLKVDGKDLGHVAKDGSTLVRVDKGQHLVLATSGELRWESVVEVEKPGQTVVKTDFAKAAVDKKENDAKQEAQQSREALVNKWKGKWFGEYSRDRGRDDADVISADYYAFTFTVGEDGKCGVLGEDGFAVASPWRQEGDGKLTNISSEVRRKIREEALSTRREHEYSCDLRADGTIYSVYGTVTSGGAFTFKTSVDDRSTTIILRRR